MNEIIDKEICTGCGACYSACPINCITMAVDEEGFYYPNKGANCIQCNKCLRVCPRIADSHKSEKDILHNAYAALSKNKKIWRRSSSGGAFSEICNAWESGDTVYIGAAWDDLKVIHTCVTSNKDVKRLCKSKYLASKTGDSFRLVSQYLAKNTRVVFCGTPCQVAGLKSYLGKDYDNLLLVDIICHGVGSPLVFEECIRTIENQYKLKVTSFEFRHKGRYYTQDHIQKVTFSDNTSILLQNDPYIQLFTSQDCLRPSCGKNCIYRNKIREGDITIGDFKHLFDVFPSLKEERYNYSTIVFNTKKGLSILKKIEKSMDILPCDISDVINYNPIFARHTFFSDNRNAFFDMFKIDPQKAIREYTTPMAEYKISIKRKLLDLSPHFIRKWVKKKLG